MTTTAPALGGEYPTSCKAVIGQETAKAQLITAARSAKKRGVSMPHTLLASGQQGIGKTTLALLVAQEMGTKLHIASGKFGLGEARMAFAELQDGDLCFIDEIHRMVQGGKGKAEWLLHYMQDGVFVLPSGIEECPKITILGATTDSGRLPETIIDRFKVKPVLNSYSEDEATKIAQGMAKRIFGKESLPIPSADCCRQVARAAACNPRVMMNILDTTRDIALVNETNYDGKRYDLSETLSWLGLSEDGLTDTARRYLVVLFTDFGASAAGQAALTDRLQEPGGLGYTERLLMQKDLITKSKGGRLLCRAGILRAKQLIAEGVTA